MSTNKEDRPLRKALWQETVKSAEAMRIGQVERIVHAAVRDGAQTFAAPYALKLLQEVQALRAKVEPQNGDHQQIVYALERARVRLQTNADELHDARDYRAEFLAEDAKRMEEAIAILTKPKVQPQETPISGTRYVELSSHADVIAARKSGLRVERKHRHTGEWFQAKGFPACGWIAYFANGGRARSVEIAP